MGMFRGQGQALWHLHLPPKSLSFLRCASVLKFTIKSQVRRLYVGVYMVLVHSTKNDPMSWSRYER